MPTDEKVPAYRSPAAIGLFLLVFVLLLTADLLTKRVSFDRLLIASYGTPPDPVVIKSEDVVLIPRVLNLHLTANQGAVFGIGQGMRWMFVLVSVVMISFLGYLFTTLDRRRWPTLILLGALLAGVIGNMWDRLTIGYVRDMLWLFPRVTWGDVLPFLPTAAESYDIFPWIFNLADSYLVVGVGVVLIHALFAKERNEATDPSPVA